MSHLLIVVIILLVVLLSSIAEDIWQPVILACVQ